MATAALIAAVYMVGGFTGCNDPVVATDAGAYDLTMIHRGGRNRYPGSRKFLMTGIAEIGAGNMIGALPARGDAIMANRAVVEEIGMVDIGRHPGGDGMAIVALLRGNNVRRSFTRGDHIVMATGTHADNFVVIDIAIGNGYPRRGSRLMTCVTGVGGINMRCALAGRDRAVMTTGAGS